jgi:hypothetical protein
MTFMALCRRSTAAVSMCMLVGLIPAAVRAQYPLVPTPVLNPANLTVEPRLGGYLIARETLRDDTLAFTIFRARIGAQLLPAPFVAMKLQADFAAIGRTSNDTVPPFQITDAYAQAWLPDTSNVTIRELRPTLIAGQFKAPFSLEYNTSSSLVLTAGRSLIVERHSARRELGVMGHVRLSRWGTLAGAVVNGEGANRTSNPDGKQMAIGRLTLLPIDGLAVAAKVLNQGDDHRWGYDGRWFLGDQLIIEGEAIKRTGPSGSSSIDVGGGYALVAWRPVFWLQPLVKWERLRELNETSAVEIDVRWTTYGVNLRTPRERVKLLFEWISKSGDPLLGEDELIAQFVVLY